MISRWMKYRPHLLLVLSFLYLVIGNLAWFAYDDRPLYWDSANHSTSALEIADSFRDNGIRAFAHVPFLTGAYPPLYHSIVAIFFLVFGKTIDSAQWANLPAMAILLAATYGIGRTLLKLKPLAAAAAAVTAGFYPILLWLSRETIIDYWLTAFVALAIWVLIETKDFSERRWSILFGIACGVGMLTKWTFLFFVAPPALWFARKNFKNAAIAALIAAFIAAYWYVPAAGSLSNLLQFNTAQSVSEGDPHRFSLESLVFYVRALEGSQLFLPLFVTFIAGLALLVFNFERRWLPIVLWIAGGWLGLLIFQNKDPRYTAPLLPAVALITSLVFQKKEVLVAVLVPVLMFQHYLVSFGIPQLPSAVVLARGSSGSVSYDWNVYTQHYFGWGPPAREDWKIEHVLETVTKEGGAVRIGLVPDIPRFDTLAFRFYITRSRLPVTIDRLVTPNEDAMRINDYILAPERGLARQPGAHFPPELLEIADYLAQRPDIFSLVERFSLPNGDAIRLYRVARS
jgi:4-amino-4-deoxy-L-arabinose transferase-like glycosyltransferase